jgi:hypothetical protein
VIRHRFISSAPSCALFLAVLAGLWLPPASARAQTACSSGCKAAYGNCYKSTHDRAKCQGQLQHCLEGCIHGKRWHAAAHLLRPMTRIPGR